MNVLPGLAVATLLLALAPLGLPPYAMTLLTEALILGLFAMSLDLMVGYTRLLSFGHAAAYGLSAYTCGNLLLHTSIPLVFAVPIAAAFSGIAAIGVAWVCTLASGVSFSMLTLAFAQSEIGARYDLARVAVRALRQADGGFVLDGEKRMVVHGEGADLVVVSARTAGEVADAKGISVFVVDPKAHGVSLRGYRTIDGLRAADIAFDGARVGADALIGNEGDGLSLIEAVVDFATALICAEALGVIGYANDATLEYLKTRRQFGAPIGTFQALQHRVVDLFIEHEQVRSMASLACGAVDTEVDARARKRVVSAAKVRIADACRKVSQECVQLHGAMGMSDEMKVSHAFRRLTVIAQQFGDADYHLERFASPGEKGSA